MTKREIIRNLVLILFILVFFFYPTWMIQPILMAYFFWSTRENPIEYLRIRRITLKTILLCTLCALSYWLALKFLFANFEREEIPGYQILIAISVPLLFEEPFFRGILFQEYKQGGFWKGACLSGLVFTCAHPFIQRLPLVFLLGIMLAVLYEYSGSIVAPILAHCMVNGVASLGRVFEMSWLAKTPIITIAPLRYTLLALTVAGSVGLIVYMRRRTISCEAAPLVEPSPQEI